MGRKGINIGENNGAWKGDNVSKKALHDYIKYHLPKPKQCDNCKQVKRLDLANISQEYKRDLSDWEWLCRKCHMTKDNRIKIFKQAGGKFWIGRKQTLAHKMKRLNAMSMKRYGHKIYEETE